jgi:hypothetical protein
MGKRKPICPRCGGKIPSEERAGEFPGALSRWDNRTEICSACGTDEAVSQLMFRENPQRAVHPTLGKRRWAIPPVTLKG